MVAASELTIDTNASALAMADAMFGNGVSVTSATYTGANNASGVYSNGQSTSPNVLPSDSGVILSTGDARDFTNSTGQANQAANTSGNNGLAGDADLTAVAGQQTFDAAVFEAVFVPEGDELTMQIIFSSEEYLEYVNSGFNDATAIWVNGVQAELTVGDGDITINNINDGSNENLYVDNPAASSPFNTEMDGFTVTLTLKAPVVAGQENTIKIGIADGGDSVYDSNLLIIGDSIQTVLIADDDFVETVPFGSETIDILANDESSTGGTLTITQINGMDVSAGDEVTLATGETVLLNADGTITVTADADVDTNTFSYEVTDEDGNTDTAFVTVDTVPCFTAGTMIRTMYGDMPVEDLRVGDRVITRDDGTQVLRWVGKKTVAAMGDFAPVLIRAGTFGAHGDLSVSPQHRVLVRGPMAELNADGSELLASAQMLAEAGLAEVVESDRDVTYYHLLFDRHQLLWANGLEAESYFPSDSTLDAFSEKAREEIYVLFPELRNHGETAYGGVARRVARWFETRSMASWFQ
ncbi:choice-of-anchor L domain-containing protein [Lentibacter algarum]|uniref:choice-of-anchor L domain-containing protein n=1 Tax=Lentibacter algarum TaxID=576131 RepID=UPI001C07C4DB|nr:choice-of-anchor L domain-containing protein [Lentibacter algarum]MBU2981293.1 choice-of-anchor L domain-containing protein [Lentibacter algarum]